MVCPRANKRHHFLFQQTFRVGSHVHLFGFKGVRVEEKFHSYGGYGQPSWGYGVRNFVFHASDIRDHESRRTRVESWIRLEEGDTRAHVWLDNTLR